MRGKSEGSQEHWFKEGKDEKRGHRPKGSRNKKTIMRAMLETALKEKNPIVVALRKELPELFPSDRDITIEELLFARMIREAIVSSKPISYMRELLDRAYGKPVFENVAQDDQSQENEWENRMSILKEQLLLADAEIEET